MKCYRYILFDNHEQAVKLHRELRDAGFAVTIAPTPRALSVCCGVAVMVDERDGEAVQNYLLSHDCAYRSIEKLEQEFNSRNDHYA